jgi:hypothetical protein
VTSTGADRHAAPRRLERRGGGAASGRRHVIA